LPPLGIGSVSLRASLEQEVEPCRLLLAQLLFTHEYDASHPIVASVGSKSDSYDCAR